jgi:hypothetical protein
MDLIKKKIFKPALDGTSVQQIPVGSLIFPINE